MSSPRLTWKDIPAEAGLVSHDDRWPLLDDLIVRDPSATVDAGQRARRKALSALIRAAFGPAP